MNRAACELCGQPAAIHDTAIVEGQPTTRHLCAAHGHVVWVEAASQCDRRLPAALSVLDDLRRMANEIRRAEGR